MILCKEEYAKAIDKAIFPGTQGGPLMHVIAAKAVCFGEALKPEFRQYQQQIIRNAKALENALRRLDVRMVSDGTDNHLLLLDLTNTSRTGKELEELLGRCNITVNKNTIPGEKLSPMIASGIRIGTPAVTTRGMVESDMEQIAGMIRTVIDGGEDVCPDVKRQVEKMMKRFPLYEGFPMNDQTSEKGLAGERQALAYLRQHGMRPVCQRYRCPYGEIDLVMLDGECLVFVEVKLRSRGRKNDGVLAVNFQKQQRLIPRGPLLLGRISDGNAGPVRYCRNYRRGCFSSSQCF